MHVLHEWYVGKYGDLFFGANAPAWFRVYVWMEAGGHFPISCWAVWGLIGGKFIFHLMGFGVWNLGEKEGVWKGGVNVISFYPRFLLYNFALLPQSCFPLLYPLLYF